MEVGQRVKVIRSLDKGHEGKLIAKFTRAVPVPDLRVGWDDKPVEYCKVTLDDGHTNAYPMDWVEAI